MTLASCINSLLVHSMYNHSLEISHVCSNCLRLVHKLRSVVCYVPSLQKCRVGLYATEPQHNSAPLAPHAAENHHSVMTQGPTRYCNCIITNSGTLCPMQVKCQCWRQTDRETDMHRYRLRPRARDPHRRTS